jgi:tetratricopeptide (TPR) repeat protein
MAKQSFAILTRQRGTMRNFYYYTFLLLNSLFLLITGCDKGKTDSEGKNTGAKEKPIAAVANRVILGALTAPDTEPGAAENNEGVGHYKEGHWKTSAKHFREAIAAGPKLAEAHYNLALALDRLGDHGGATQHFGEALNLAPDNPKIKDSKILKEHLGM